MVLHGRPLGAYIARRAAATSLVRPLNGLLAGPPSSPSGSTHTHTTHARLRKTNTRYSHTRTRPAFCDFCCGLGAWPMGCVPTCGQCSIDSARAAGALRRRAVRRHDHRRRHSHQGRQRVVHAPAGLAHLSEQCTRGAITSTAMPVCCIVHGAHPGTCIALHCTARTLVRCAPPTCVRHHALAL